MRESNVLDPGVGDTALGEPSSTSQRSLEALMRESDELDAAIVDLLEQRFRRSRAIGGIKAAARQPKSDPDRVRGQQARFVELCKKAALDPPMCETLITTILAQVIAERSPTDAAATHDATR